MFTTFSKKVIVTVVLITATCIDDKAWPQAQPDLVASPSNYDWGVISITSQATSEVFTITNNTQSNLNLTSAALTSGKDFSISSNTCSEALEPSNSCQIAVTPGTIDMGSYSDALTISDNNNQTLSIGVHSIVELANGFGWGANNAGQVGDGQTEQMFTPVTAISGGIRFINMSAGDQTSCGLNYNGTPFCWGEGGGGQLGNGTYSISSTPTAVSGNYALSQISVGSGHVCGITNKGSAICWGGNTQGELGNNTSTSSPTPVNVAGSMSFSTISASNQFTCGTTFSGKSIGPTYCWGVNSSQQLGSGPGSSEYVPNLVPGGHSFIQVVTGNQSACGLTSGGSAYCWGAGSFGEIGNGGTSTASAPTLVSGGLSFTSLTAGDFHFCGLISGGQAFCWGYNNAGQIGNNAGSSNALVPVAVVGGYHFKQISAGVSFTCGLLTTDELMCWGSGSDDELGTGSSSNSAVPVPTNPSTSFSGIWSSGSETQNGLAFQ